MPYMGLLPLHIVEVIVVVIIIMVLHELYLRSGRMKGIHDKPQKKAERNSGEETVT
ncbi:MAG: hypothetical protein MZV70_30365 [Desulfobacterales bacterium]|nr:hypothetical protein [Desulfobacterales bacterium]